MHSAHRQRETASDSQDGRDGAPEGGRDIGAGTLEGQLVSLSFVAQGVTDQFCQITGVHVKSLSKTTFQYRVYPPPELND